MDDRNRISLAFDQGKLDEFVSLCKTGVGKEGTRIMKRTYSRVSSLVYRRMKRFYSVTSGESIGRGPGNNGHTADFLVKKSNAKGLGGYARIEIGFVGGQRYYKARFHEFGSFKAPRYWPSRASGRTAMPGERYTKKSHPFYGKYRGILPARAPFAHGRASLSEAEIISVTSRAVDDVLKAAAKWRGKT